MGRVSELFQWNLLDKGNSNHREVLKAISLLGLKGMKMFEAYFFTLQKFNNVNHPERMTTMPGYKMNP